MINKKVKIKVSDLIGWVTEVKMIRGLKVIVVELENGSTWQGKEERLVFCE